MNNILLVSEETIKKYTLVNDNVDGKYILPTIQVVQDIDLDRLIGKKLVNKLCELVNSGDIYKNTDYKALLDDYVSPYICWDVMAQIQLSLSYKFNNSGTTSNLDDKKSQVEFKNLQLLIEQYTNYANSYATKLKNYLDYNSSKYPEYNECYEYSHKNDVSGCGIYLDDIPYNKHSYKFK